MHVGRSHCTAEGLPRCVAPPPVRQRLPRRVAPTRLPAGVLSFRFIIGSMSVSGALREGLEVVGDRGEGHVQGRGEGGEVGWRPEDDVVAAVLEHAASWA